MTIRTSPETVFNRHLLVELEHHLKDMPHQIFRIESNLTRQGIPDIYCCVNGRSFWIETKVDDNELAALQWSWHKQHQYAKGRSFIIYSNKEGYRIVTGDKY